MRHASFLCTVFRERGSEEALLRYELLVCNVVTSLEVGNCSKCALVIPVGWVG